MSRLSEFHTSVKSIFYAVSNDVSKDNIINESNLLVIIIVNKLLFKGLRRLKGKILVIFALFCREFLGYVPLHSPSLFSMSSLHTHLPLSELMFQTPSLRQSTVMLP